MGSNIQQWEANGHDCQKWVLTTEAKPAPSPSPEPTSEPTAEPTSEPTLNPSPVPEYKPGDINGDSKHSILDLILLKNILSGSSSDSIVPPAADTNSDGTVNAADLTKLIKILAGAE